eukprot:TRINITY_DN5958_c0_g1_i1.p1 TRINITY_DN5958_c0_g1~~TRINITY_DN5958_c0_g1_i1.p1  ORF type:complete len:93 (-),score=10.17 TRINITY_DN5958_c0_g1_i1:2-280(-)
MFVGVFVLLCGSFILKETKNKTSKTKALTTPQQLSRKILSQFPDLYAVFQFDYFFVENFKSKKYIPAKYATPPHVLCVDTGRSSETAKAHRG